MSRNISVRLPDIPFDVNEKERSLRIALNDQFVDDQSRIGAVEETLEMTPRRAKTLWTSAVATWLATPSSANLRAAVTDETGTGALVFGTAPTVSDPVLTGDIAIGTNADVNRKIARVGSYSGGIRTFTIQAGSTADNTTATGGAFITLTNALNAGGNYGQIIYSANSGGGGDGDHIFKTAGTNRMVLKEDGRLYGTALHNNAGAVTGTTNQYIASGTYTPTLTNATNITSSTAYVCQWMRVGNVVTVSGMVDINPTAAAGTFTTLRMSLPIASTLGTAGQLAGTAVDALVADVARVYNDAANAAASLSYYSNTTGTQTFFFHFTYVVN